MDLEKVIHEEVKKVIESGVIEEKIQEVLADTINSAIKSAMGSWSDFGTALKEKLSKSFALQIDKISIPEYGSKIVSYVTDELDLQLKNNTEKILQERIKKFFKPLEKDEYTVSEIVEEFKERVKCSIADDYDQIPEGHEITAFIEKDSRDYFNLYLDTEPNKSRYECEYMVRMDADGIWHIRRENSELHKMRTEILNTFERYLFKMFSQKVKIINDEDRIDNYIPASYE